MKYNNYYLSDICDVLIKTINPKNTPDNSFKVYSLPGFDNKRTPEFLKGNQISSNKIILSKKCILFNKLNLKFKRVWRYENVDDISISSTEFIPIVCNEEIVDFDYLYYYLINDSFYLELQGNASGTSNSHQRIHKEDLLKKQIQLPSLEVQKTISSFLRKIDDKIEYNDLIINNLKDIVGAYYEEMFIKNINKSNFLEISLATLMHYQGGSQPPASQFEYRKTDDNVRFVQIRDFENDEHICYIPIAQKNKLCNEKDILIARYGASLGRICYGINGAYNVALAKVFPKKDIYREFIRNTLERKEFYDYINQVGQRSAQSGFNASDIEGYKILFPQNEEIILKYDELASTCFNLRIELLNENKTLFQISKMILPKLIEGILELNSQ